MSDADPLLETLEDVAAAADSSHVTLGKLIEALDRRGFGPVIMVLSALIVLPTGAIPGLPAIVGAVILLIALQLLLGVRTPWLPRFLSERRLSRHQLLHALDKARPAVGRLSRYVRPRVPALATGMLAARVAALALGVAATFTILAGFIPFLPFALGLVMLLIGIAMTARDGLFMILGLAAFLPAVWLVWQGIG